MEVNDFSVEWPGGSTGNFGHSMASLLVSHMNMAFAAGRAAVETPATRVRPNGPEDAQVRIAAAVREIEIICDEFGFDPVQWLMPNLENDMPGDAVSENASHE